METEQAAEAILFLYDMFDIGGGGIEDWIAELKPKWPVLAAAVQAEHNRRTHAAAQ